MQTPETAVKVKIKKWLAKNAKWWTAISDRYHIGLPDFLCILDNGVLTAIEAKSDVGKLTRRQLEEARRIIAAGGAFFVARPDQKPLKGSAANTTQPACVRRARREEAAEAEKGNGFVLSAINERGEV